MNKLCVLRVNQNKNWQPRKVKTVNTDYILLLGLIRVDTKGTCCNIMASRAWVYIYTRLRV